MLDADAADSVFPIGALDGATAIARDPDELIGVIPDVATLGVADHSAARVGLHDPAVECRGHVGALAVRDGTDRLRRDGARTR